MLQPERRRLSSRLWRRFICAAAVVSTLLLLQTPYASAQSALGFYRDPAGRQWVVASTQAGSFSLRRFDAAGVFLRSVPLTGATAASDFSIASDPGGDAWVLGAVSTAGPRGFGVWHVSADGQTMIGSSTVHAPFDIFGGGIAVDASSRVWVTAPEKTSAAFTVRFSLWRFEYNGALSPGFPVHQQRAGGIVDGGLSIAIDAGGDVWAAGISSNPAGAAYDLTLWRYAPSGAPRPGFPVYRGSAYETIDRANAGIVIAAGEKIWVSASQVFPGCPARQAALFRFDRNGTVELQRFWHNSAESESRGREIALASDGSPWVLGHSSQTTAVWSYDRFGALTPGYPRADNNLNSNGIALDAGDVPWVVYGSTPAAFVGALAVAGAAGLPSCAQLTGGMIAGSVSVAGGAPAGSSVTIVLSSDSFRGSPHLATSVSTGGASVPFTATVETPGDYQIGAFLGNNPGAIGLTTPIGFYRDFQVLSLAPGASVSGVDFTLALDTVAPSVAITFPASGSTITALAFIEGTAADANGVSGDFMLAVQDQDANLWRDEATQSWVVSSVPIYKDANELTAGPPNAREWTIRTSSSTANYGRLSEQLIQGHRYRVLAQARDFVGRVSVPGELSFTWNGPSAAMDAFPPSTVTDLRVSAVRLAQGQADLAWTAPSDDFSGVARYFLFTSTINSFGANTSSVAIAALAPGATVALTVSVTADRALYFGVKSQDNAGNLSFLSNTAVFDPIPPSITSINLADGATLSRPRIVTVQAADDVAVGDVVFSIDGIIASTDTTFPFSFLWNTPNYPDGVHALSVAAHDAAGNASPSSSISALLNYAPPAQPVIASPVNGFAVNVATIAVSGTAEPGTSVSVLVNGASAGSVFVPIGPFLIPNLALPGEGSIALTAVASDARGASPQSFPVNGVFTTGLPNAPVAPGAFSSAGGKIQLFWAGPGGSNPAAFYRVYRSTSETGLIQSSAANHSYLIADTIGTLVLTDLPAQDGLYFYGVTSVDAALNESVLSEIVPAVSDRLSPTASVDLAGAIAPLGAGPHPVNLSVSKVLAAVPLLTITPRDQSPIAIDLSPLTPLLWRGTFTVTTDMNAGTANFAFQGADFVGNVGSTVTAGGSVFLRPQGPVASVALSKTSPLSIGLLGLALTLDEAAVTTPALRVVSQSGTQLPVVLIATSPLNGTAWRGTVIISTATGDGPAQLIYSATDQLGNLGTVLLGGTTSFLIDTTPPGLPQVVRANPGPAGIVVLSWSAPLGERPAYYNVYRDGIRLSTRVTPAADGSGSYVDLPTPGQHQHDISAVDLAGNEGPLADPLSESISTPPPAPINLTAIINAFGQIQVSWQAGSATTVSYRLYRATYTIMSVAGLAFRSAAPPFVETSAIDGIFHYVVTGLDAVGNVSAPSAETVILYDQGIPSISVTGVSDGGYFNTNVSPAFAVADVSLDTASVRAFLDGAPFISGSLVSAAGPHTLVVRAANTVGHVATSTTVFTIDKVAPLISFSVGQGAAIVSTTAISVSIGIMDANLSTTSFALVNQTLGTFAVYHSGDPIVRNGQYVLSGTATDKAGNVSTGTLSFHLEVAPFPPASLSVVIQNTARLSWAQPEPNILGYRVYRDGARISASLYNGTFFEDTGYTAGAHVYEVSAVDAAGVEGARARASVPAAAMSLRPITLTRGFNDAILAVLQNNTTSAMLAGPAVIQILVNGAVAGSAVASAVNVAAGQNGVLEGDIAISTALPATVVVNASVALPTDFGAQVSIAGNFTVSVADPVQPVVELFPAPLVKATSVPIRMKFNNRGSAPMSIKTAAFNGFTPTPSEQAALSLLTMQGTLLSKSGVTQTTGVNVTSQIVGGFLTYFASVPGGSSFLFDPVSLPVPSAANGSLIVAGVVNQFSGSLTAPIVSSAAYRATVSPNKAIYDQGPIVLSGQAFDIANTLVPGATVQIGITSKGFSRSLTAVTGSTGSYMAVFNPLPTEAGVYALSASNPQAVSNTVQSSFTIIGFLFSPDQVTVNLAQNTSVNVAVTLSNTGETALNGLTSSLVSAGSGLSAQVSGLPGSLTAGGQVGLNLTVQASALASVGLSSMTLIVTDSHGFSRQLVLKVQVSPALPLGSVTPSSLQLGMLAGSVQMQTITLENKGFATWQGVSVTQPGLPWVALLQPGNIGDIPPGGSVSVGISFAPPANQTSNQYSQTPLVRVLSANAPAIDVNAGIAVTSSQQGTLAFNVINADRPRNALGQGVGVPGTKVTLTSLSSPGLVFTAVADANGVAVFASVPSGNYSWQATAAGFQTAGGTTLVQPGLTQQLEVLMLTSMVTYNWSVTPTTIVDRYDIALDLTFRTDVLAPALVLEPKFIQLPMKGGETAYTQYTITNKGLVSAFNVKMAPSVSDPAMQITLPFTSIPELKPGQSVTVPVKVFLVYASGHLGSITNTNSYTAACGSEGSQSGDVAICAGDEEGVQIQGENGGSSGCGKNGTVPSDKIGPITGGGGGGGNGAACPPIDPCEGVTVSFPSKGGPISYGGMDKSYVCMEISPTTAGNCVTPKVDTPNIIDIFIDGGKPHCGANQIEIGIRAAGLAADCVPSATLSAMLSGKITPGATTDILVMRPNKATVATPVLGSIINCYPGGESRWLVTLGSSDGPSPNFADLEFGEELDITSLNGCNLPSGSGGDILRAGNTTIDRNAVCGFSRRDCSTVFIQSLTIGQCVTPQNDLIYTFDAMGNMKFTRQDQTQQIPVFPVSQ